MRLIADKPYNRTDYLAFLSAKFNFSQLAEFNPILNHEFERFEQLGIITTADKKTLPVFEIHIKAKTKLARNRVQLRNLVAKQVGITEDGALAVYVDEDNNQWRFSFIAIEYKVDQTNQIIKDETTSKRYTYLLGENTQTRTAVERFKNLNKQSTLDDLKTAFAVESLNKEFYTKLYKWYVKAQSQNSKVTFPNDEQAQNHTQTSLIRLLTRLLFVWFLKEKKLINADLFKQTKLKKLINWQTPSSFYKAILQNLFFATLSTDIKNRKLRSETRGHKGINPDFGNQYVFRYKELFKDQNAIQNHFNKTPFLNGGLFDCLDDKKSGIYIDGFTSIKKHQPILPNSLFFNTNERDLGLISLFDQYQFTVEESTPLDIEVALDPELLGKVFENLLATYNPETGDQARKDTGSFYTPREIVSYMVDKSLKAHLIQKVPPHDGDNTFYKQRLDDLFNASDSTDKLPSKNGTSLIYNQEIPKLIAAISQIKILDPAVGSGAYPMGLLHRMTALLALLDPDNKLWMEQQLSLVPSLASIEHDLKISEKINDHQAQQQAKTILNDKKQAIRADFKKQDHNYLRKLYLIENCIYGVDIQPIAILITQLRFFISLTIEQTSDQSKENFGIQPLPNLDYHFEVGDSLCGLPKDYSTASLKNLLAEIKPLKHQFFLENDHHKKDQLKKQINNKIKQCYQNMEKALGYLVSFDFKIDFNEVFATQEGFDLVLGNPPYSQVKRNIYPPANFPYSAGKDKGKQNLYKLFTEQSYNLCKTNGVATMIVQSSLMCDLSATGTRQLLLDQAQLQHIIEFPKTAKDKKKQVFDSVTQGTCIYQFIKQQPDNNVINISINNDSESIKNLVFSPIENQAIEGFYPKILYLPKIAIGSTTILCKIANNTAIEPLAEFIQSIQQGDINLTTHSTQFSNNPTSVKLMRGRYVERYKIKYEMTDEYIVADFRLDKIQANQDNHFLISQEVTGTNDARRLHFASKDNKNEWVLWGNSVNKTLLKNQDENPYFLALLNSKFMDWYFRITSSNNHVGGYEIKQLPIPKIPQSDQQPFIDLVDKIIQAKQNNQPTTDLEEEIDKLVYQLYHLTDDEIGVIEDQK